MSFDIFLQRFEAGDGADADAVAVRSALEPYLAVAASGYACLHVGGVEADIYGVENLESGFMVNHVGGPAVYDALVGVAQACDLVIIPVGCATAVIDDRQRLDLPEELAAEAVRVSTGQDLRRLIESG